jgi:carboxyl-terminal processing protease
MLKPGIGYIAMTGGFNQTTYAEFRAAMKELKDGGMQSLILDLRNNGGGLVGQAYRVANVFLGRGDTVFSQRGRVEDSYGVYRAENPSPDTTPIVVLVNRNTASASEILAGALQDHDRALIVGENTFGKGLVQNPFQLEYGSMLLLTIAKYETPSGRLIQRDYSNGDLYSYYSNGGTLRDEKQSSAPKGAESKTVSGRSVYGGGGIAPDVVAKPQIISVARAKAQEKLADPIFKFALDTSVGRVKGFETYKVETPIKFSYDIAAKDFPFTEDLFQAFRKFAMKEYRIPANQIDAEREFIERTLRSEFVTAAYGTTTSFQVFNDYDSQIKQAVEAIPQAKQLEIAGAKASAEKGALRKQN